MKMVVPQHDLAGACVQCGITLAKLSENTGIPEQELFQFAAGQLALNARDRFAILNELAESQPDIAPRELRPGTREAYRTLMLDVVGEELFQEVVGEDPDSTRA